jgi:hypothetical protein
LTALAELALKLHSDEPLTTTERTVLARVLYAVEEACDRTGRDDRFDRHAKLYSLRESVAATLRTAAATR